MELKRVNGSDSDQLTLLKKQFNRYAERLNESETRLTEKEKNQLFAFLNQIQKEIDELENYEQ
jgi:glutathionylspermidine synthase